MQQQQQQQQQAEETRVWRLNPMDVQKKTRNKRQGTSRRRGLGKAAVKRWRKVQTWISRRRQLLPRQQPRPLYPSMDSAATDAIAGDRSSSSSHPYLHNYSDNNGNNSENRGVTCAICEPKTGGPIIRSRGESMPRIFAPRAEIHVPYRALVTSVYGQSAPGKTCPCPCPCPCPFATIAQTRHAP